MATSPIMVVLITYLPILVPQDPKVEPCSSTDKFPMSADQIVEYLLSWVRAYC